MSVGSPIAIQKANDGGGWDDYLKCHLLDVNPEYSYEALDDGGEQSYQRVVFVLRYRKALEAIEYDMPNYRIVWRGHAFDIRYYDDFKYRHKKVTLRGVSRD